MSNADGSFYEGQYKNGLKHGSGVMTYPNGQVFVGTFENDKKHGLGTLFDLEKSIKQREQWLKGSRKEAIKTPASREELLQQMKNPGYINKGYSNNNSPEAKRLTSKVVGGNTLGNSSYQRNSLVKQTQMGAFK